MCSARSSLRDLDLAVYSAYYTNGGREGGRGSQQQISMKVATDWKVTRRPVAAATYMALRVTDDFKVLDIGGCAGVSPTTSGVKISKQNVCV